MHFHGHVFIDMPEADVAILRALYHGEPAIMLVENEVERDLAISRHGVDIALQAALDDAAGNNPPAISDFSIDEGDVAGGDVVTCQLDLFEFYDVDQVTVDGQQATDVSMDDTGLVTFTTPAGDLSGSPVDIVVHCGEANVTATASGAWTYTAATPTYVSIDPATGDSGGGEVIRIQMAGTTPWAISDVLFGGDSGIDIGLDGDGVVTATTPLMLMGPMHVFVVFNPGHVSVDCGEVFTAT